MYKHNKALRRVVSDHMRVQATVKALRVQGRIGSETAELKRLMHASG